MKILKKLIVPILIVAICILLGTLPFINKNSGDADKLPDGSQSGENTDDGNQNQAEETVEPLPAGPAITLNGVDISDKTVLWNNIVMVPEETLRAAVPNMLVTEGDDSVTLGYSDYSVDIGYSDTDTSGQSGIKYGGINYLPMDYISSSLSFAELEDSGMRYITPDSGIFVTESGRRIPILMYHACSDDVWGMEGLFVSPSSMEEQLKYLVDNGYQTITFEDLNHLEDFDKPVMLTFDDGYRDNYENLYPLLKKYDCKATIFVIAAWVGGDDFMTEEQLKEMSDSGYVSIQSHTLNHVELDVLGESRLIEEMEQSRLLLTRYTGKEPFVISYPNGKYSDLATEVGARYYAFGIRKDGGIYTTEQGTEFVVTRVQISRSTSLSSFASIIDVS